MERARGGQVSTGVGENGGGRETRVFSLFPSLSISSLSISFSVSSAQIWQEKAKGEASPADFWPQHRDAEATAGHKVDTPLDI